ncbi:MAG: thioredoxin family protein [Bacteroidota bacterium]|nr:thioredoxin family protein [Bacteroidota bacterium]
MEIKVLGTGCSKCKSLEKATIQAISESGIDATIIKVEDFLEIMKLGVMTTPALVVDGKVLVKGRVPSVAEISQMLINAVQAKEI